MNERNYGLDLLKSASMLMVIILHVLGVGGILAAEVPGSGGYYLSWMLETVNMCAVNCFGLVSGYVLCKGRYRGSRLLSLWLRVAFEGILITLVFWLIMPAAVGKTQWYGTIFPVLHNTYWYFTGYFALFFFVPFINRMLEHLSQREKGIIAASIVLLFCFLNNFTEGDVFALRAGYGFLWLLSLYLIGAFLRGIPDSPRLSITKLLLAFCVCAALAFLGNMGLKLSAFIGYTSPFILLCAVALLFLFRKLRVKAPRSKKTISMLSRTSFGVYIIHTHPLIWYYVLNQRFALYAGFSPPVTILCAIGTALGIYLGCTLIDWLVEKLFKLIRVNKLEELFDKQLQKALRIGHK